LVFVAIITLVIAVIIGLSYPIIAKAYATGEVSLKVASARDIALLIDTICAYPYDMKVQYELDLSKFILEFYDNKVKIYSASYVSLGQNNNVIGRDPTYAEYSFVPCNNNLKSVLKNPEKLVFSKKGGELSIS